MIHGLLSDSGSETGLPENDRRPCSPAPASFRKPLHIRLSEGDCYTLGVIASSALATALHERDGSERSNAKRRDSLAVRLKHNSELWAAHGYEVQVVPPINVDVRFHLDLSRI